jgi:hypothetical protein
LSAFACAWSLLLHGLLAPEVLAQGDAASSGAPPVTFKLVGGVSHSDKLEALPESERVGSDVSSLTGSGNTSTAVNSQAGLSRQVTSGGGVNPTSSINGGVNTGAANMRQPISLMARPPHIDNTQANYKKLLRQLALQSRNAQFDQRNQQSQQFKLKASQSAQGSKVIKVPIKVPMWLAGIWQRTDTTEVGRQELPSGKALPVVGRQAAIVTDVFGTYKDKKGQIFMLVPLMATGSVDHGFAVDYSTVRKYQLLITGPNTAVVRVQASHQVVNKKTQKVVESYQDEELNQYTLIKDGVVRTDSSVKVFDQMGSAKMLTKAVSMEKRLRRFM